VYGIFVTKQNIKHEHYKH